MQEGVVNYLVGMEIFTIGIVKVDILYMSLYDSTGDRTQCTLIVIIDRKQ